MKTKHNFMKFSIVALCIALLWLFAGSEILEARGSFGGFRGGGGRSFGGSRSRSFSTPKRSVTPPPTSGSRPGSSFGGKAPATSSQMNRQATSFGGTRLNAPRDYTAKYGTPRRTVTSSQMSGIPNNYVVHDYGGYGSGLMMGYMMGHSSWMWAMPFHPAFYYSRPYYAENPDGTVSVYPPTFSWSKLIFTFLIFFAIIYIIYVIVRNRRRRLGYYTSSQSSFS